MGRHHAGRSDLRVGSADRGRAWIAANPQTVPPLAATGATCPQCRDWLRITSGRGPSRRRRAPAGQARGSSCLSILRLPSAGRFSPAGPRPGGQCGAPHWTNDIGPPLAARPGLIITPEYLLHVTCADGYGRLSPAQKVATCSVQFAPQTTGCWLSKIAVIPLAGRSSSTTARRAPGTPRFMARTCGMPPSAGCGLSATTGQASGSPRPSQAAPSPTPPPMSARSALKHQVKPTSCRPTRRSPSLIGPMDVRTKRKLLTRLSGKHWC